MNTRPFIAVVSLLLLAQSGIGITEGEYEAWIDGYMADFRSVFSDIPKDSPLIVTVYDHSSRKTRSQEHIIKDAELSNSIMQMIRGSVDTKIREEARIDDDGRFTFRIALSRSKKIVDVSWLLGNGHLLVGFRITSRSAIPIGGDPEEDAKAIQYSRNCGPSLGNDIKALVTAFVSADKTK